jgi:hypothetical protein
MHGLGRALVLIGMVVLLAGVCVLVAHRLHLPLGRLPGDIRWRGKNSAFDFPIATCLLLSVLFTLLLYLFGRFRR